MHAGWSRQWRCVWALAAVLFAAALGGCGTDRVAVDAPPVTARRYAVLGAFPAELAPLLAQATVEATAAVNGKTFRFGTLAGVPVVLGLTGIGLLNAAATTAELLDRFPVDGVIVSAVAGSDLQVGAVAVPERWTFLDGSAFDVDADWFRLAGEVAAAGAVFLERCTLVANPPPADPVCMLTQPAMVMGGIGQSNDPYTRPFPCQAGGNDIFGCDVVTAAPARRATGRRFRYSPSAVVAGAPVVVDMETAAIAREAAVRGVPFIAFRGVSDGGGDPLDLPPFVGQFAAYYRFAARNAATAAMAFLEALGAGPDVDAPLTSPPIPRRAAPPAPAPSASPSPACRAGSRACAGCA